MDGDRESPTSSPAPGVAEEMDDAEESDVIDGIDEADVRFDELDAAEALPASASIQEYDYRYSGERSTGPSFSFSRSRRSGSPDLVSESLSSGSSFQYLERSPEPVSASLPPYRLRRRSPERGTVSASYVNINEDSPEGIESVSASLSEPSLRFSEDREVGEDCPSPAPSNSGLDVTFENGPALRRQLSTCTPSSSGSILSSSLSNLQEPQTSDLGMDPIFPLDSGESASPFPSQAPPVSSWPGNQDLPISSSWADNTSEWPGSHYGRRADHSRYRQEESQSQFRNGVGQSQLRNGSSQSQFRNEVNKSLHRNGADQPQYRNGVEQQQYRNQEDQSQFSADQSNYRNGMNQSQYRNGIDQYRNTTSGWNSVTDWETLPGTSGAASISLRYGSGAEAAPVVASRPVGAGRVEGWETTGSTSSRNSFNPSEAGPRSSSINRSSRGAQILNTNSSSRGASGSVNSKPVMVSSMKVLDTVRSVLGLPGQVNYSRSLPQQTCSISSASDSLLYQQSAAGESNHLFSSLTFSRMSSRIGSSEISQYSPGFGSMNNEPAQTVGSVYGSGVENIDSRLGERGRHEGAVGSHVEVLGGVTGYVGSQGGSERNQVSGSQAGASGSQRGAGGSADQASGGLVISDVSRNECYGDLGSASGSKMGASEKGEDGEQQPGPNSSVAGSSRKNSPSTSSNSSRASTRSAVTTRSTPAKRSINFPDSPAPEPKRSRLMQEQVRPDSPSVNPDSHPSRNEGEAGGSGINLDVPDDDRGLGGADGNFIGGGGTREELTGVNSSEPAASYSSHLWRSLDRFAETEPGPSEARSVSSPSSESRGTRSKADPASRSGHRIGPSSIQDQGPSPSNDYGPSPSNELGPSPSSELGPSPGDRSRVGSTDSIVPSPRYEEDWDGPNLVSGSELISGQSNPISRRTFSESSEAEGTVTYNRDAYMLPLHLHISNPEEGGHHDSGSEVSESGPGEVGPGPSQPRHHQPQPPSPSESDASVPESSQYRELDTSPPNSPSGSELDEPGPSVSPLHGSRSRPSLPGSNFNNPASSHPASSFSNPASRYHNPGPSYYSRWVQRAEFGREAAPAHRAPSPEPYRYRSRNHYSDQCLISSSTGPSDSNPTTPPTPEYFQSRDIDNDISSSPRHIQHRNYRMDEDNVVDSTVDSTSGTFMIPSPVFQGNEAEHDGDSDSDMNDSESIAGSEASSTTASLSEHTYNMPGLDDNEGISTSGQVDNGTFRLVPNDYEVEGREGREGDTVPDIQGSISSDDGVESLGQSSDQETNPNTFKRPFNRKGRLIDNYENEHDPVPGPSGSPGPYSGSSPGPSPSPSSRSSSLDKIPVYTQGSLSLSLVSSGSDSSISPPPALGSARPSVSLFPVKSSSKGGRSEGGARGLEDDIAGRSYASLGIGLAFSGLPSSLVVNNHTENKPEKQISGPLSKRLRTRHMQEVANQGKDEEVDIQLVEKVEPKPEPNLESRPSVSVIPIPSQEPEPGRSGRDIIPVRPSEDLEEVIILNPSPAQGTEEEGERQGDNQERRGENQLLLGGTQQSFNLIIQSNSIPLAGLKPKKLLQKKSALELRELFDLDSLKNDSSDLPLSITDAINDVEIGGEENLMFNSDSKLIRYDSRISQEQTMFTDGGKVFDNVVTNQSNTIMHDKPSAKFSPDSEPAPLQPILSTNQSFLFNNQQVALSNKPSSSSSQVTSRESQPMFSTSQPFAPSTLPSSSMMSTSQFVTSLTEETPSTPGSSSSCDQVDSDLPIRSEHTDTNPLEQSTRGKHIDCMSYDRPHSGKHANNFPFVDPIKCDVDSKQYNEPIRGKPIKGGHVDSSPYSQTIRDVNMDCEQYYESNRGEQCMLEESVVNENDETENNFRIQSGEGLITPPDSQIQSREDVNIPPLLRIHSGEELITPAMSWIQSGDELKTPPASRIQSGEELNTSDPEPQLHHDPQPGPSSYREHRAEESSYQTRAKSAKPSKCLVKPGTEESAVNGIQLLVALSYSCHICDRKFERQCSLSRHLTLHKCDKKFKCDECGQKFSHTHNLERHKNRAHNQDPTGASVRCTNCGLWFSNRTVLKVHMFSHNPEKDQQNWTVQDAIAQSSQKNGEERVEEMKFECPCSGCGLQYDTWLELVEHTQEHGAQTVPGDTSTQRTGSHKCELCWKIFATEERLKKHMRCHMKDERKPLECPTCGKRFINNSALGGHVKIHAAPNQMYDCPLCGVEFEHISSLKDHVPSHKVNNKFTCPTCNKVFDEYQAVRKHIRAFHSQQRYTCDICKREIMGKTKYDQHLRTHSSVKEFFCTSCDKQFKRKDKLSAHMKKQHPVREQGDVLHSTPAVQGSGLPGTLGPAQPHVPVQAGPSSKVEPTDLDKFLYKCEICQLGFKRRGMLVNHLAKRHPEIPVSMVPELNLPILKTARDFYCQYCDKVYKSNSKRKVHIQKNHPGEALPPSTREVGGEEGKEERTYSLAVGSITSKPHNCQFCHKQYASKPKLYQHQRNVHSEPIQFRQDNTASTSKVHNKVSSDPSLVNIEDSNSFDVEGRLLVDQRSQDGEDHFSPTPGPSRPRPGPGEGSRILYSPTPGFRSNRIESLGSSNGASANSMDELTPIREINFNSESRLDHYENSPLLNSLPENLNLSEDKTPGEGWILSDSGSGEPLLRSNRIGGTRDVIFSSSESSRDQQYLLIQGADGQLFIQGGEEGGHILHPAELEGGQVLHHTQLGCHALHPSELQEGQVLHHSELQGGQVLHDSELQGGQVLHDSELQGGQVLHDSEVQGGQDLHHARLSGGQILRHAETHEGQVLHEGDLQLHQLQDGHILHEVDVESVDHQLQEAEETEGRRDESGKLFI